MPSPDDPFAQQRYEPLPGLLGLPKFIWRRLSGPAKAVAIAAFLALAAGVVVAVPKITSGKREGAAEERRTERADTARAQARLRVDQAPHRGRAVGAPRAPLAARQAAIVAALERSITADSRTRLRAGRLPGPQVKETVCNQSKQLADLQPRARRAGGAVLACLAATSVNTAPGGKRFAIGFEFLAVTNWRRGTFTWCKTNPPPGEQFGGVLRAEVALSRACVDPSR
jgi:hypothetical protein